MDAQETTESRQAAGSSPSFPVSPWIMLTGPLAWRVSRIASHWSACTLFMGRLPTTKARFRGEANPRQCAAADWCCDNLGTQLVACQGSSSPSPNRAISARIFQPMKPSNLQVERCLQIYKLCKHLRMAHGIILQHRSSPVAWSSGLGGRVVHA